MMIDVKTLCLGVLSRGDASGYDVRKEFEEGPLSHFSDAAFGLIYPALKRLEEEGLIVMVPHSGDGRSDKKMFRITPSGRHALDLALMRPPAPDKLRSDLMFVLTFGQRLPRRQVERMIHDRIDYYRQQIIDADTKRQHGLSAEERFVEGMSMAMYKSLADYMEVHCNDLLSDIAQAKSQAA